jgi:hypothetical protein
MLTPKERRDRIFKKGRPFVRPLRDDNADIGILWVAYKAGSFSALPKDLSQDDFLVFISNLRARFTDLYVVEDFNPSFPTSGRGPVMLVGSVRSEMILKAEFNPLSWARSRNLLRSIVAFLNMAKHSKKNGVCMVSSKKNERSFWFHFRKYDLLHYVGRVAPDEYLFSLRAIGSD